MRAWEAAPGSWRNEALLLADDADAAGDFEAASEEVAGNLATLALDRVYLSELDIVTARRLAIERWRRGAFLVNYYGHGGTSRLAAEGLLTTADVGNLDAGAQSPILVAMTCVVGRFEVPDFDSLGERLMLERDGGAIAVWAPTGLSTTGTGRTLAGSFYATLTHDGVRLGDAILAALRASGGGSISATQTLLGDPALRVAAADR